MDTFSYLLGKKAGGGGSAPTLQSKEVTITENGTQSITPDTGYDGLSGVSVTTNVSGADLSEYFNNVITNNPTNYDQRILNYAVKRLDNIIITQDVTSLNNALVNNYLYAITFSNDCNTSNVTNLARMFYQGDRDGVYLTNVDLSNFDTSNVTTMAEMFKGNVSLKIIDLSSFDTSNVTNMSSMFSWCTSLEKLDIRNFTFDSVSNYTAMFNGPTSTTGRVPANCEIIVKSDTEKTWITSKFNWLTNVKTVAEYEAE